MEYIGAIAGLIGVIVGGLRICFRYDYGDTS